MRMASKSISPERSALPALPAGASVEVFNAKEAKLEATSSAPLACDLGCGDRTRAIALSTLALASDVASPVPTTWGAGTAVVCEALDDDKADDACAACVV